MDHIDRLKAAVMPESDKLAKWEPWLRAWCKARSKPGKVLRAEKLNDHEKAVLWPIFERNLLAEVYPADVLRACDAAREQTQVVQDLELGSASAKELNGKGEPKTVFILQRDLVHLLGLQPTPAAKPEPESPAEPDTELEPRER